MSRTKTRFPEFYYQDEFTKRLHVESEHKWRTVFERDRDRILYSKSFQRLHGKTQVFISGYDDHIRNRLTHTLEVAQIGKTIAHRLGLNEILVEAIALGHDLGHTPFGHVGERVLNLISNSCIITPDYKYEIDLAERGFKHNFQSIKVLEEIEHYRPEYQGLNISVATLWGILNHSSLVYKKCKNLNPDNTCQVNKNLECRKIKDGISNPNHYSGLTAKLGNNCWSVEAFIVYWADEIAQRHHDVADAIEANILKQTELNDKIIYIFKERLKGYKGNLLRLGDKGDKDYLINSYSSWIVNYYVEKIINEFIFVLPRSITKCKKGGA